jgi:MFS family permease
VSEPERLLTPGFVRLLCVQFCFGLSYSTFFLLPKFLTREFHASADVIGAVASVSLIAGVLATPWMGAWLDRGSRRPFIRYGALVNAVSGCGFALVHSASWPIFALRIVNGVSYVLVFNAIVTLATDLAPPRRLSQAIGLCGAASMASNAVAPAIAEYVADHQGWPLVWLLGAAAALCAALLSLGLREPRAAHANASHAPRVDVEPSAFSLLKAPSRRGAFVCAAANGAAFGVMFTFTQPLALLLGANKVSAFFIGYTFTALIVRLGLGTLADTWGRRRVAFGALVLYGLVAFMTAFLRPSLLFFAGAGLGLAHGLLYPAINAIAAEGVPHARRGALMSYFYGAFAAGFALWVLLLGVLARSHGYPIVFTLTALLVWSSIPFLPRQARGAAT